MSNLRGQKYGHAPTNGKEIREQIEKNSLTDLEYSLVRDKEGKLQKFLNDVVITDKFEYCVFSSPTTISLIKEFTTEDQRFFILDGTFSITPKGVWQQILILQINFGLKVSKLILKYLNRDLEILLMFFFSSFSSSRFLWLTF